MDSSINWDNWRKQLIRKAEESWRQRKAEVSIQDNAAGVSIAEAANCGFELLSYSFCLSDLASSDFWPFPKLKSPQRGYQFGKNDEVICVVEKI